MEQESKRKDIETHESTPEEVDHSKGMKGLKSQNQKPDKIGSKRSNDCHQEL